MLVTDNKGKPLAKKTIDLSQKKRKNGVMQSSGVWIGFILMMGGKTARVSKTGVDARNSNGPRGLGGTRVSIQSDDGLTLTFLHNVHKR